MNDKVDLNFNGWELATDAIIQDTDKFAMVVTFSCPTTATVVTVNSISLNKGDIATRPGAQTANQVLEECQYYYSKSFPITTVPAQNAGQTGLEFFTQTQAAGATGVVTNSIHLPTRMRVAPSVTLYNPVAGNAQVRNLTVGNNATNSVAARIYTRSFSVQYDVSAASSIGDGQGVHWTADARIGV